MSSPAPQEHYLKPIPVEERGDLIAAYHKRLTSTDEGVMMEAARAWSVWEGTTSKLFPEEDFISIYSGERSMREEGGWDGSAWSAQRWHRSATGWLGCGVGASTTSTAHVSRVAACRRQVRAVLRPHREPLLPEPRLLRDGRPPAEERRQDPPYPCCHRPGAVRPRLPHGHRVGAPQGETNTTTSSSRSSGRLCKCLCVHSLPYATPCLSLRVVLHASRMLLLLLLLLLQAWPEAEWKLIHDAGHSAYEPGIQAALLAATDKFASTA